LIWFDLFGLQSLQLVEHSCSARMNWDLKKVIIIIIIIIITIIVIIIIIIIIIILTEYLMVYHSRALYN